LLCGGAPAQQYPTKPVKLIVTYPPAAARPDGAGLSARSSARCGAAVIIEEQTGRGRLDRNGFCGQQAPDGYSFVVGNIGPAAVNPLLSRVPYDVQRDFVAISLISTGPQHPHRPS